MPSSISTFIPTTTTLSTSSTTLPSSTLLSSPSPTTNKTTYLVLLITGIITLLIITSCVTCCSYRYFERRGMMKRSNPNDWTGGLELESWNEAVAGMEARGSRDGEAQREEEPEEEIVEREREWTRARLEGEDIGAEESGNGGVERVRSGDEGEREKWRVVSEEERGVEMERARSDRVGRERDEGKTTEIRLDDETAELERLTTWDRLRRVGDGGDGVRGEAASEVASNGVDRTGNGIFEAFVNWK